MGLFEKLKEKMNAAKAETIAQVMPADTKEKLLNIIEALKFLNSIGVNTAWGSSIHSTSKFYFYLYCGYLTALCPHFLTQSTPIFDLQECLKCKNRYLTWYGA